MNEGMKPEGSEIAKSTAWMPNPERLRFWARKIGHFGIWQIAYQALQLFTGLLLANWLSIEAYSEYGVALGFQNMLNILTDLGITGSIIALVGDRIHDRETIGRFTRAALSFRNVMLLTLGPALVKSATRTGLPNAEWLRAWPAHISHFGTWQFSSGLIQSRTDSLFRCLDRSLQGPRSALCPA